MPINCIVHLAHKKGPDHRWCSIGQRFSSRLEEAQSGVKNRDTAGLPTLPFFVEIAQAI
jgi:hypothetical protein